MRITIDTEIERIIVPNTFFRAIDKKNEVLKEAGVENKTIDYTQYVKDCFEKAVQHSFVRKSDVPTLKGNLK